MNNINIINKFLLDNDNGLLFVSNVSEEVSIFYKMLIEKLSKRLYYDLIFVSKASSLLTNKNASLFNNKELYFYETSTTTFPKNELLEIVKKKKVLLLVSYGLFKKEAKNFLSINAYDYKKDISIYLDTIFKSENISNSSKKDFLYYCYNNPHLFFCEFSKYELNQNIINENKVDYKDSVLSVRQSLYKLKNDFTLKSLPLIYKIIKDEVVVKKFNY